MDGDSLDAVVDVFWDKFGCGTKEAVIFCCTHGLHRSTTVCHSACRRWHSLGHVVHVVNLGFLRRSFFLEGGVAVKLAPRLVAMLRWFCVAIVSFGYWCGPRLSTFRLHVVVSHSRGTWRRLFFNIPFEMSSVVVL